MPLMPLNPFRAAAARHVAEALGLDPAQFQVTVPPDAKLGDYAVALFPAAKAKKGAPPALASELAAKFQPTAELSAARAAGPYLNFDVDRGALYRHVTAHAGSSIPTSPGAGKTVVIDFSSPNISKQLAYHHIRSTMIGWALVNLHRALGYTVVGTNFLGDWGTTHGMLLAAYQRWPIEQLTIAGLHELYRRFRAEMKDNPALEEEGRAWFKKLEDGDAEARRLWSQFRTVSLAEFEEVYRRLGVRFDEYKGESEYEAAMPGVIQLLEDKQLVSTSEGALVVSLDAEGMPPCLLRKADGATLYATRDLAAAIDRFERHHFERCLYVVDKGQGLHFKQFFTVLKKAGFAWAERLVHVDFGQVRIGGKKAGSRAGEVVLLKDVLDEATERSLAMMKEIGAEVADPEATARMIGTGAILFANVRASRIKDVDFDWDEVISIKGSAAPYIQYTHARIASIERNAGAAGEAGGSAGLAGRGDVVPLFDVSALTLNEEWALAKALADLPDVVLRAADECEPHQLGGYLLELCSLYSNYYALGSSDPQHKVLTADPRLRAARLALSGATRATLAEGLKVLGIGAPAQM